MLHGYQIGRVRHVVRTRMEPVDEKGHPRCPGHDNQRRDMEPSTTDPRTSPRGHMSRRHTFPRFHRVQYVEAETIHPPTRSHTASVAAQELTAPMDESSCSRSRSSIVEAWSAANDVETGAQGRHAHRAARAGEGPSSPRSPGRGWSMEFVPRGDFDGVSIDSADIGATPRHRRVGAGADGSASADGSAGAGAGAGANANQGEGVDMRGVGVSRGVGLGLGDASGMGGTIGVGVGAGVGKCSEFDLCGHSSTALRSHTTGSGYGDICVLRPPPGPAAIHRACPAPPALHLSLGKVEHSHGPHTPPQKGVADRDAAVSSTPGTTPGTAAGRPAVRARFEADSLSWTVN